MTAEREQSTQGSLMRPAHALHALVDYYAVCRADWPLSDVLLCAAAWYHVPHANIVYGVAVKPDVDGAAVAEPYWWVRAEGKDYDLLKMAEDRRAACQQGEQQQQQQHAAVAGAGVGPTHELVDCSGPCLGARPTDLAESGLVKQALLDVMAFKMPTCPACRGRHRAHTCDDNCQSPWKTLMRALREDAKARPWEVEQLLDRRLL